MEKEIIEVDVSENGKKYKELLTEALAYVDNLEEDAKKHISLSLLEASRIFVQGTDDIYVELTYEVIKRASSCGIYFVHMRYKTFPNIASN